MDSDPLKRNILGVNEAHPTLARAERLLFASRLRPEEAKKSTYLLPPPCPPCLPCDAIFLLAQRWPCKLPTGDGEEPERLAHQKEVRSTTSGPIYAIDGEYRGFALSYSQNKNQGPKLK
jgi:hypothetical protein